MPRITNFRGGPLDGNSLARVIEKPILERIGAEADTPFDISTDGQVLILAPVFIRRFTRPA